MDVDNKRSLKMSEKKDEICEFDIGVKTKKNGKYDEIIKHPHYEPKWHRRMSKQMRAAQFAPYAALAGHANAVQRTVRFAELRSKRVIEMNVDGTDYEYEA